MSNCSNYIEQAEALSVESPYNFMDGSGKYGIIANGVSYNYVTDAVRDLGLEGQVKILRIGFSHPMPGALIKSFVGDCEKVLVVEEGEPYMEEAVKAFAQEAGYTGTIKGKAPDLFSRLFEFDPAMVRNAIAAYFGVSYDRKPPVDVSDIPELPQRPPESVRRLLPPGHVLCGEPGHQRHGNHSSHGYRMLYPGVFCRRCPPEIFLSAWDHPPAPRADLPKPRIKKVISYIGDSTFFHSGIPGLINAVFNNHDMTLIILDNSTTAMTGHQPNPGVDMQALNFEGFGQVPVESVVRGIGVPHVSVIRPYNVKKSIAAIREAIDHPGGFRHHCQTGLHLI